jgi:dTDP-4-amino-4,6-dideoxygalactose transaminase
MSGRVLLSPPDIGELEETYLLAALRSGWVAPVGPDLDAFEREVAERVGVEHAVAVSSGTAALHLALLALGVGPSHTVVVPTLTFAATANAVVYTGASPVFVDCSAETGNLDPDLLSTVLDSLARSGQPVGAVMPVDMFGSCADYASILPLCAQFGVPVVEDAAEALGARYVGRPPAAERSEARGSSGRLPASIGRPAGSFGVAGVLSFNGNKILTTSGGGMLVSDDGSLVARCRYLATQARQPVAHYEHTDIGYNYRLSNLLAALGRAQLRRLDEMMARRRYLRDGYAKLFAGADGVRILGAADESANCWLTTLIVDPAVAGWHAGDLAGYLAAGDIETRPVWKPMHLQPVFAGARAVVTGSAQRLFETGVTLPSGSALDDIQVRRVFDAIDDFLSMRR